MGDGPGNNGHWARFGGTIFIVGDEETKTKTSVTTKLWKREREIERVRERERE